MRVYMADVHPIPSHGKRGALVATSLMYVSERYVQYVEKKKGHVRSLMCVPTSA